MVTDQEDVRVADLWSCRECGLASVNPVGERTCPNCGGGLEYLGELEYTSKGLGGSDGGE